MTAYPINISGEISKREVGLIVIILLTILGAIYTSGKNDIIAYSFMMLTVITITAFIMAHTKIFDKEKNCVEDFAPAIEKAELLNILSPSALSRKTLIHVYEQIYLRVLNDKNVELAEGLKTKIEELKKQDQQLQ